MSSFPSNISRVPNLLTSRIALSNINRTNLSLFDLQAKLATGRAVNRPSDDPIRAATILTIDDRLELATQRLRNMDHATSALGQLDTALGEVSELLLEAKEIASSQTNVGASAEEREAQALVVQSLLDGLFEMSNRQSLVGHMFAGSTPGRAPVEEFLGGFRYVGRGSGLITDLGLGSSVPVTLGESPLGRTSARVQGSVSFDLSLTPETMLKDLHGGRGLGVEPGVIEFEFGGGPRAQIDLSHAKTIDDVVDEIRTSLREYEAENSMALLGPNGVSIQGGSILIDVQPNSLGPDPVLEFMDVGGGTTAEDLGLVLAPPLPEFSGGPTPGMDLDPILTWQTPVTMIDGAPLGSLELSNGGQNSAVDLSGAQTFEDVRRAVEDAGLGLRVEIDRDRNTINIVNEVSAGRSGAMSISALVSGDTTAERLGIRSFSADTRIEDLNFGRGVRINTSTGGSGTGFSGPNGADDFRITLGDGREIDIDLRPEDIVTIGTVIQRINDQVAAAGVAVPSEFEASVAEIGNGIQLRQTSSFSAPLEVSQLNNSYAFGDLGFGAGSSISSSGNALTTEDRARIRVDSVFSDLIDLRDSLRSDDRFGITFAGEDLEISVSTVAQARGIVGGFQRRVEQAIVAQEDKMLIDEQIRSELRDLDFTSAAVQLNLLQTQLSAGLQTTALLQSRSLLDFLG